MAWFDHRQRSGQTQVIDEHPNFLPTIRCRRKIKVLRDSTEPVCAFAYGSRPGRKQGNSGKVLKTHSVSSVRDYNFGMLAITEIALKFANAIPPTHFISWLPSTAYVDLCRRRPAATPLTCFARLARGQSLSTGHRVNFQTSSP